MHFYIVIFIILALLAYFVKRNLTVYVGSIGCLVMIAGFRGINMGVDTHFYLSYFNHFHRTDIGYMEPLWNLLNKFVLLIGGNYNVFLLLVSGLTLGIVAYVLWRELKNPQFGLFVYYGLYAFCNSFNGARQYLAISVVVLGFYFLNYRKNVLFFLTVFIASLVHQSALLAIAIFPFRYFNVNRWLIVGMLFVTFLIGATIFPQLDLTFLYGKYASYVGNKYWMRTGVFQAAVLALLMNAYMLFITFTIDKVNKRGLYFNVLLLGILCMNLTFKIEIMSRVLLYFTIIQILLIPLYLNNVKQTPLMKISLYLLFFLYISAIFLKMLLLGNNEMYSIYPYVFQIY